ncbi:DNA replication/repair protein RecF [Haliscomenobacter hydrossis]|uniref:DNA replication and repair protein RecF n=1 Tax=Haliscomenobacter hydrossis (strain ATCC 27775 / DSM 1100 / LMG 10767 / O) TaxID=760192 RepID=F4KTL3_HALH1|nr:DNA replication and repair protein RecF [Haliscomenobacter hydrossis]AEE53387.1 DNA replication and repair protein recF [Haliscomenobacter hydrossis DSM 1100]
MYLERIALANFKNYENQKLDCSPRLNCLVGNNGMGKTNLLDAIYYLCMAKSHFNLTDNAIARHHEAFFRLEGHFVLHGKKEKIVAKVMPRKLKELERNDVAYAKLAEHIGLLPVVFIGPDDIQLIREGSEERRRFLDNTLSQLDQRYLYELIAYNKVLHQRNALLKNLAERSGGNLSLLDVYDEQLIDPALYVLEQRAKFAQKFTAIFQSTHQYISGRGEEVQLTYESQLLENDLGDLLANSRQRDLALQRTTKGIHRDDLVFSLGEHPLKKFGSQGQLKSFLLALKLAQYEMLRQNKAVPPILLLDDLFDKLDAQRVTHLLRLLTEGQFGQIFITDTHETRIAEIVAQFGVEYRRFVVEDGKIG